MSRSRSLLRVGVAVIALAAAGGSSAEKSGGFVPVSFTAVSENDYWVLGSVPCRRGRCAAILRTTNGGSSFVRVPAPPLSVNGGTVVELRFADRLDGFAYVARLGVFYATHDGGVTWHRLLLGTMLGFATGGGNVYALTARCSLQRCTGYRFKRSPVRANAWSVRALPFAPGDSIFGLAAHGSDVRLLGTPAGQERWVSDELARSGDGGRTFVTGRGPCVRGLGGALSPTSARVIWAVCPTGMLAGAWRSTDGGVTFAHVTTPPLVNSAVIAPASRDTAVVAGNGAGSRLLRTTNGGGSWKAAHRPRGATYLPWIGFTDARVGAAVAETRYDTELWRTTDGGADWSAVSFG